MAYRYRYNDALLAEGERAFVLQDGRLCVRTGVLSVTPDQITYRLREVYDDAAPVNHAPVAGDVTFSGDVSNG